MTISFDRAVDFYDATRGFAEGVNEQIRDAIINYTGASKTSRFLELGIGTGRIAIPFIRAGYDYTGVDVSTAMMARLNQKLSQDEALASYRYHLQPADVTALPFSEGSFDLIITVAVLHLLEGWQKALQEAKRVLLKPGGTLVISDNIGQDFMSEGLSPLKLAQKKWSEIHAELENKAEYKRWEGWIPEEKIGAYLEELGATVQKVTLVKYTNPELSLRDAVTRITARNYSADWETPEEIHREASARLEKWLEEYPEPDRKISLPEEFNAIIAKWSK
ncbi:MAG: class I SAM-dependent methyltransferase [Chloroflexota bacterium]|nr:methyltransferase domain-containing protein [Chloroflexota bacterium]